MSDKYDDAIAYFDGIDDDDWVVEITDAWQRPGVHPHGCLFKYAGIETGDPDWLEAGGEIGCLTQIKRSWENGEHDETEPENYPCVATTKEITEGVCNDPLIPSEPNKITLESLERFAYWQREVDKAMGWSE